jgi:soluble cytochrome b562
MSFAEVHQRVDHTNPAQSTGLVTTIATDGDLPNSKPSKTRHTEASPTTKTGRKMQNPIRPTMDEAQFDNLLVKQKDRIIKMIDSGNIIQAQAALEVVREMWEYANYGYKYKELELRLNIKQNKIASNARASFAKEIREGGR